MADKLFGTDGVRGKANVYPMTSDFALKLGKALGTILKNGANVAIGKDTRISGDMLEAALTAGLTSMGANVEALGVMPTPTVAMLTPRLRADMSIVISASHNPYYDNGIKLINSNGHKFSDDNTALLESLVRADNFELNPDKIGKVHYNNTALRIYLDTINGLQNANALPLSGLRVVLDCANGAFSNIAPEVLKTFGAEVIAIGVSPDGYNINKDCGSTATDLMAKTVVKEKADIGIALDGDGDRIIICDEKGKRIDGDQIIAFLGSYLADTKRLKGKAVVATIWSNMGLEKFFKAKGIDFYRTAVGERYVTEKMLEIGSNFGGEESGHMVLADFAPTGDGLIAGIVVCMGLLKAHKKMSEIFPIFEKCPCEITNIRFSSKDNVAAAMNDAEVQALIEQAKTQIAGVGSVIVRKSGTEPMIKVRVEGEDGELVSKISKMLVEKIERFA